MKIKIEIINTTRKKIKKKRIKWILKEIFSQLIFKKVIRNNFEAEISVVFVGEKRIRTLNSRYRSQDKKTDILSFCYERNEQFLFGELIICPQVIVRNIQKDKISFKKELTKNLIHGVLHLLGYHHGKVMFLLQDELTIKLKERKII